MTAIVASNASCNPDSNSSGTSTTAARGWSAELLEFLAPLDHALPDSRPQQALEPLAVLVSRERFAGDLGRLDAAESLDHRSFHVVSLIQLAHYLIRRQHRRPQPLERRQRCALTGSDPAGQPNERNAQAL